MLDAALHDRALFRDGTLVLADLHVGKDAASAVEARLGEHEDLTSRVATLVERFEPEEVVVAGDLLHSFEGVPRGVGETLDALVGIARDAGAGVVVTPGNHDTMLETLWDGPVEAEYDLGTGTVVCHGHVEPASAADCYVVGHDHPTIEVEGTRRPCYLYGDDQYRGATVVMLPAFTRLAAGVAVNRMRASDFQSPLVTDADTLRPAVWDDDEGEVLWFPPLGEFRRLL